MRKRRLPGMGERVKLSRRSLAIPGVLSITEPGPVSPSATSGVGEPERPSDELSEDLIRTIKAAYQ